MLFKLLPKAGAHTQTRDGVDYTFVAGDVIESEDDLVAKFQNKFVRLDAPLPDPSMPQPTIPVSHRFIKDETLVAKQTGDAETGDVKVAGKDFV